MLGNYFCHQVLKNIGQAISLTQGLDRGQYALDVIRRSAFELGYGYLQQRQALRRAQWRIALSDGKLVSEGLRDAVKEPELGRSPGVIRAVWNRVRDWHRLFRCLLSGKYLRVPRSEREMKVMPLIPR